MIEPSRRRPWTDDTRIAFLLALRLTGSVGAAAAEIGRVRHSCYGARKRDPAFAAKWDAVVTEQAAQRKAARAEARVAERAPDETFSDDRDASGNRLRRDGLTTVKRRAFLRGLSESGSVEAACRGAGVSDTAVYNLRGRDADFAAAWDRALRVSAPALEQIAWERAVEGWEEPVFAGGKQVGTRWRHSPGLLRDLLVKREKQAALADDPAALRARAEEAARAAGGSFSTPATREETNATLMKKLKAIEHRLGIVPPPRPGGADGGGEGET